MSIVKTMSVLVVVLFLTSCAMTDAPMQKMSRTIEVEKTKDELYVLANDWMISSFNDAKSVIQFSDKGTGNITGKYLLNIQHYQNNSGFEVYAIIKIQVKDGKSKITIISDNIKSHPMWSNPYSVEKALVDINDLFVSYENYINNNNTDF